MKAGIQQVIDGVYAGILRSHDSVYDADELRNKIIEEPLVQIFMGSLDGNDPPPDEVRNFIIREIESRVNIRFTEKSRKLVSNNHFEKWLTSDREKEIDWCNWDKLREHLTVNERIPAHVIDDIEADCMSVLGDCGDPKNGGRWRRSGLVIGHVQSGKTTNYSALCSMAISAGYKVIIILAGTTNDLRKQTQERIEENLIGAVDGRTVGVGKIDGIDGSFTRPIALTNQSQDANQTITNVGGQLLDQDQTSVLVVKKNYNVLAHLRTMFERYAPQEGLDLPLLLIDDEADYASINTAAINQQTRINEQIREILGCFSRRSYVAYTATPFANVFVNHVSDDDMKRQDSDLFPSDFIISLPAPSNYVGAERMFLSEGGGNLRETLQIAEDTDDLIPFSHKKDFTISELPGSLRFAIRYFCLFCCVRDLTGHEGKNHSMMINVSRFNAVQGRLYDLVREYLEDLKNSVRVHSNAIRGSDQNMEDFLSTFINGLNDTDLSLKESLKKEGIEHDYKKVILPNLLKSMERIDLASINMQGSRLEYPKGETKRIIAIGGQALSRGITLQGLAVSYFKRRTLAADTLLQMGRWFGYRPGYERLTRVFLHENNFFEFRDAQESVEQLISEISRMVQLDLTPLDFGLKVRNSETGLALTARNKSRHTETIQISKDFKVATRRGARVNLKPEINRRNWAAVKTFVESDACKWEEVISEHANTKFLKKVCNVEEVLHLMDGFTPGKMMGDVTKFQNEDGQFESLLQSYLKSNRRILRDWDVIVPLRGGSLDQSLLVDLKFTTADGFCDVGYWKRKKHALTDLEAVRTDSGSAVGTGSDFYLDMPSDVIEAARASGSRISDFVAAQRQRPALFLHFLRFENFDKPVNAPTLSFVINNNEDLKATKASYLINTVEQLTRSNNEDHEYDDENDEELATL